MKDQDSKDNELAGLEKDIDQAIDSLFVEKGGEKRGSHHAAMTPASDEPAETPLIDAESRAPAVGEEETPLELLEPLSSETAGLAGNQEGLEKDIDQAIDSLFVEKGGEKRGSHHAAMTPASDEPAETPLIDAESRAPAVGEEETPLELLEPLSSETDVSLRNLENLETHLLSLEWEISPGIIDKIVAELGFLKEGYRNDRDIFRVVDLMSKVTHSLADDEGNITPQNLRFLLDAKDGIKLLSGELKGKEEYKNLVLSGILARYQLMQNQGRTRVEDRGDSGRDRDFESLTRDLRDLSQKLQVEVRQLGSLAWKLQARRDHSVPAGMVETFLVQTSGRVFAIEKDDIIRSFRIPYRMVRAVWGDREIRIQGVRLPLINLSRLLKLKGRVATEDKALMVIRKGDRTVAMLVDRLLQKRVIPLKRIRDEKRSAYVRGILPVGPGRNIYFLDTDRMMMELNR